MSLNWFSAEHYAAIASGWCPQCRQMGVISQQRGRGAARGAEIVCQVCGWSLADDNASGLSAAGTTSIPQHWLLKFYHLRKLHRECEVLRGQVLEMLDRRASIEPGLLNAEIQSSTSKRVSWPVLARLLGKVQSDALKNRIEPTQSSQLIILPSSWPSQSNPYPSSMANA